MKIMFKGVDVESLSFEERTKFLSSLSREEQIELTRLAVAIIRDGGWARDLVSDDELHERMARFDFAGVGVGLTAGVLNDVASLLGEDAPAKMVRNLVKRLHLLEEQAMEKGYKQFSVSNPSPRMWDSMDSEFIICHWGCLSAIYTTGIDKGWTEGEVNLALRDHLMSGGTSRNGLLQWSSEFLADLMKIWSGSGIEERAEYPYFVKEIIEIDREARANAVVLREEIASVHQIKLELVGNAVLKDDAQRIFGQLFLDGSFGKVHYEYVVRAMAVVNAELVLVRGERGKNGG